MSFFLLLLLALLPVILNWILAFINKKEKMSSNEAACFHSEMDRYSAWLDQLQAANDNGELNHRQQQKSKKALDLFNQIKAQSGAAGCQI